jgi:lipopolysaccharide assembly outer membrane protein LptD (OstA)
MHRLSATILFLFCCCAFVRAQQPKDKPEWFIEAPGGVIDPKTGAMTATNYVRVKYADSVLTAQRATLNQETGEVEAEGNVRLQHYGQLWIGEKLRYNFKTGKMVGEDFRTGQPPLFAKGDVVVGDKPAGVYVAVNGLLTGDDRPGPEFSMRAKTLIIVPGEYVEAKHAVFYIGEVPVFYLPVYRRSLKVLGPRFELTPGYRSQFGPFLESSYNWYWNERLYGSLHLDGRAKRGVGVGPDLHWRLPRFGEGTAKYYYARDEEPGLDVNEMPIDDDRHRLWLFHQATPRTNLTVKGMLRYQSDVFVVRDFFESEYRKNVQPNSYLEADQLWSNYSLELFTQPQVNDFYDTVERLPEVRLRGLRQQIAGSPFYYEADSSFGYYRRSFADGSTNLPFSAFRGDTFHQVDLPRTFFGWLNVTPRAGGRLTHYTEAHDPGAFTDEEDRAVFNTGAEVSLKASRVWPGVRSPFWQVDGLRHIVQPSVNYVFVPHPTTPPRQLPQFDYELPSTRLLPIEFPDYNSIDSIDTQNVLRLGLRNKFQTKRKQGIDNLVHWALYTDWRLNPRDEQPTFSDIYSDLDLRPFSWLTLNSEVRYHPNEHVLREANHRATFLPGGAWSWTVGHRYLREDPRFGENSGNNLIFSSLYYRLNENWGARATHHYEMTDGTMEEQQYTLYHDFRSWTGALSFRIRDQRTGSRDYSVGFTFSFKAVPRFDLGDDANKPSLLLGR